MGQLVDCSACVKVFKRAMMKLFILQLIFAFSAFGLPLATQEDVATEIAMVVDLEETEFAAENRDAKAIVEQSIDAVRDLEETDFAAEPRDAEAVSNFIEQVRDLE